MNKKIKLITVILIAVILAFTSVGFILTRYVNFYSCSYSDKDINGFEKYLGVENARFAKDTETAELEEFGRELILCANENNGKMPEKFEKNISKENFNTLNLVESYGSIFVKVFDEEFKINSIDAFSHENKAIIAFDYYVNVYGEEENGKRCEAGGGFPNDPNIPTIIYLEKKGGDWCVHGIVIPT